MKKLLLFLTILGFVSTSCKNAFEEMVSKDSEEAILYSARMALAEGDWTLALSEFARLSATTLAEPDVVVDRASAYSGRCGLDFLELADLIENIGSTPLLTLLMQNFPAVDSTNFADCKLSEDLLKTIADSEGIVSTERGQFLMAFNSLAKIGAILNHRADSDDDGTPDAAWDPCDDTTGATDLPQNEVSEIGTGIVLFYKNMQGFDFGADLTAQIDSICTAIDGSPADFCDEIDISGITNNHRALIRSITVESDDDIGLDILPGGAGDNIVQCM